MRHIFKHVAAIEKATSHNKPEVTPNARNNFGNKTRAKTRAPPPRNPLVLSRFAPFFSEHVDFRFLGSHKNVNKMTSDFTTHVRKMSRKCLENVRNMKGKCPEMSRTCLENVRNMFEHVQKMPNVWKMAGKC